MTGTRDVWADWVTIWQSEMAAMVTDRELQEAALRGIDRWAAQTVLLGRPEDAADEAGGAGPVPPSGAAPAVAPPGERERTPVKPGRV